MSILVLVIGGALLVFVSILLVIAFYNSLATSEQKRTFLRAISLIASAVLAIFGVTSLPFGWALIALLASALTFTLSFPSGRELFRKIGEDLHSSVINLLKKRKYKRESSTEAVVREFHGERKKTMSVVDELAEIYEAFSSKDEPTEVQDTLLAEYGLSGDNPRRGVWRAKSDKKDQADLLDLDFEIAQRNSKISQIDKSGETDEDASEYDETFMKKYKRIAKIERAAEHAREKAEKQYGSDPTRLEREYELIEKLKQQQLNELEDVVADHESPF